MSVLAWLLCRVGWLGFVQAVIVGALQNNLPPHSEAVSIDSEGVITPAPLVGASAPDNVSAPSVPSLLEPTAIQGALQQEFSTHRRPKILDGSDISGEVDPEDSEYAAEVEKLLFLSMFFADVENTLIAEHRTKEIFTSSAAELETGHITYDQIGSGSYKSVYNATFNGMHFLIPVLDNNTLEARLEQRTYCAYARALEGVPGIMSCEDHMSLDGSRGYLSYTDVGRLDLEAHFLEYGASAAWPCVAHHFIRVAMKTLDTVHGMAQRGYVHRDILSKNVIFNDEGEPTIIDYGRMLHVGHPAAGVPYKDTKLCPLISSGGSCYSAPRNQTPPESREDSGLAAACRDGLCDAFDVYSIGNLFRYHICEAISRAVDEHSISSFFSKPAKPNFFSQDTQPQNLKDIGLSENVGVCARLFGHISAKSDARNLEHIFMDWLRGMLNENPRYRDHATEARTKAAHILEALKACQEHE